MANAPGFDICDFFDRHLQWNELPGTTQNKTMVLFLTSIGWLFLSASSSRARVKSVEANCVQMSYSGKQWSTHRYSIHEANPSFNHKCVHHSYNAIHAQPEFFALDIIQVGPPIQNKSSAGWLLRCLSKKAPSNIGAPMVSGQVDLRTKVNPPPQGYARHPPLNMPPPHPAAVHGSSKVLGLCVNL